MDANSVARRDTDGDSIALREVEHALCQSPLSHPRWLRAPGWHPSQLDRAAPSRVAASSSDPAAHRLGNAGQPDAREMQADARGRIDVRPSDSACPALLVGVKADACGTEPMGRGVTAQPGVPRERAVLRRNRPSQRGREWCWKGPR